MEPIRHTVSLQSERHRGPAFIESRAGNELATRYELVHKLRRVCLNSALATRHLYKIFTSYTRKRATLIASHLID
jgi:hypothetical protein